MNNLGRSFSESEFEHVILEMCMTFARLTCGKKQVDPVELVHMVADFSWQILFSISRNPASTSADTEVLTRLVHKHMPEALKMVHQRKVVGLNMDNVVHVDETGIKGVKH